MGYRLGFRPGPDLLLHLLPYLRKTINCNSKFLLPLYRTKHLEAATTRLLNKLPLHVMHTQVRRNCGRNNGKMRETNNHVMRNLDFYLLRQLRTHRRNPGRF